MDMEQKGIIYFSEGIALLVFFLSTSEHKVLGVLYSLTSNHIMQHEVNCLSEVLSLLGFHGNQVIIC